MACGAQFVTTFGLWRMQRLPADSWDLALSVRLVACSVNTQEYTLILLDLQSCVPLYYTCNGMNIHLGIKVQSLRQT